MGHMSFCFLPPNVALIGQRDAELQWKKDFQDGIHHITFVNF